MGDADISDRSSSRGSEAAKLSCFYLGTNAEVGSSIVLVFREYSQLLTPHRFLGAKAYLT